MSKGNSVLADNQIRVNGREMRSIREFFAMVRSARIGDVYELDVERGSGPTHVRVVLPGFEQTRVRVEEMPDATPRQRRMQRQWAIGTPTSKN